MLGAYTMFPNRGIHTEPLFISKIEDKNGNVSSLNAKRNDYAPYTAYFNFKCK